MASEWEKFSSQILLEENQESDCSEWDNDPPESPVALGVGKLPSDPSLRAEDYMGTEHINRCALGRPMHTDLSRLRHVPPAVQHEPKDVASEGGRDVEKLDSDEDVDDIEAENEAYCTDQFPPQPKRRKFASTALMRPQKCDEAEENNDQPAFPAHSEKCWLCTFALHPRAKALNAFIMANVNTMDTVHMAAQIKDDILGVFPRALGAKKREIVRHINEHMLAPNVKIASVLKSLVSLAQTLRVSASPLQTHARTLGSFTESNNPPHRNPCTSGTQSRGMCSST